MDNKVKYIPVKALKQELAGCQLAIQCDQGSTYEIVRHILLDLLTVAFVWMIL